MTYLGGNALQKRCLALLVLAGMLVSLQGCSYLRNRGADLCDLVDVGITVSSKPQIGLYVDAPFIELFPIGYANVDARFTGIGGGMPRFMAPHYEQNYGGLVWGQEERTFDYGKADLDKMTEEQRRQVLRTHHAGVGGVAQDLAEQNWPDPNKIRSWPKDFASCPHYIHLGYIGVVGTVYYWEPADLIAGLVGLDLSGDDNRWENMPKPTK